MAVNRDHAKLCQEIQSYNELWGRFVWLTFLMVISKTCFQAYIVLFQFDQLSQQNAASYVIYPIYFLSTLIWYTRKCASIEKYNNMILIENLKFYLKLSHSRSVRYVRWRLIKADELQQSHRLDHFCIRMYPSYSITSRSFSEIISYVFLLFIYVIDLYR